MKTEKRDESWQKSPTGWWIADVITRFEYYHADKRNPRRRCIAHEDYVLFKARSATGAYKKAVAYGRRMQNCEGVDSHHRKGRWRYVGIVDLLPVYDAFEDGCEVLWILHNKSFRSVMNMVSPKAKLRIFRKAKDSKGSRAIR